MTKFTKIIYLGMFLLCITALIFKLIERNFYQAMNELALLCWVGVSFMGELRCNKLEKEINEIKK
jgi:hypothetical protein